MNECLIINSNSVFHEMPRIISLFENDCGRKTEKEKEIERARKIQIHVYYFSSLLSLNKCAWWRLRMRSRHIVLTSHRIGIASHYFFSKLVSPVHRHARLLESFFRSTKRTHTTSGGKKAAQQRWKKGEHKCQLRSSIQESSSGPMRTHLLVRH